MKIFVDTDVLLDVALSREPFNEASEKLLDYLEANPKTGFIAWHSITNLFYLASKGGNKEKAIGFIVDLCGFISVASCSNREIIVASNLSMSDFEDALQCAAALACHADVLVTRNVADYKNAPVKVMTPADIVSKLAI